MNCIFEINIVKSTKHTFVKFFWMGLIRFIRIVKCSYVFVFSTFSVDMVAKSGRQNRPK